MATKTRLRVRPEEAPPSDTDDGAFHQVATLTSETSGAHWVTPFGIPFPFGVSGDGIAKNAGSTQRAKMFAKYGVDYFPIQSEQFNTRADGKQIHHVGHVKLPAGYVARDPVQIGFKTTEATPSTPNWATLTAGGDDFSVVLSIWEPVVHWLSFTATTVVGDVIEVVITDAAGAHTYTHTSVSGNGRDAGSVFTQIRKKIQEGGLYKTFGHETVVVAPSGEYGLAWHLGDEFRSHSGSTIANQLGTPLAATSVSGDFAPRKTLDNAGADSSDRWPSLGFYLWPVRTSGEPEAYTVDVTITRGSGSSLSVYTNHSTTATSGRITALNTKTNRATWTANFDDATDTADSPWFDGHQIHQIERKMAFMSGATPHVHLEAWFRVSWDKDGTIVDRQVTIENNKMYAAVRDYWYDAEVFIGASSQTSGQAKYQGLYHPAWEQWRWAQAKPAAFCLADDFMRARMILPWVTRPTVDRTAHMACKLRGFPLDFGTQGTDTSGTFTRGYVKSSLNNPLYPGAWDFGQQGGGRVEIGLFNNHEWAWWTGDMLATWPSMEAMVDNVSGAYGAYYRDEIATGEDAYGTPHWYYKWYLNNVGPTNIAAASAAGHPEPSVGRPRSPDNLTNQSRTITQKYSLKRFFTPINSHCPNMGLYSAWIARPEKYLHDKIEMWARHQSYCTQPGGSGPLTNEPKTGSTAYAADHTIGWQMSNGNRTPAWTSRAIMHVAFSKFEGARRRVLFRRLGNEIKWIWNRLTERTVWGEFNVPPELGTGILGPNSVIAIDDLSVSGAIAAGYKASNHANYPPPFYSYTDHTGSYGPDAFKSNYMNMTLSLALALNVIDIDTEMQTRIDACTWTSDCLEHVPNKATDWTWFLGGGNVSKSGTMWYFQNLAIAPNNYNWYDTTDTYTTWTSGQRANLSGLMSLVAAMTDTQKRDFNHRPTTADVVITSGAEPGYIMSKQHHAALLLIMRYNTNATKRAQAEYWYDKILDTWPADDTHAAGTADLFYQQLGVIKEADIGTY